MTRTLGVRVISVAAVLMAVSPAFSQKGGATGTGSTGTGTTGTGTTGTGGTGTVTPGTGTTGIGRTPTTTTPGTPQPTTPQIQQPIFVSGRVMMEDGAPFSEAAVIQTVCNGTPRSEGYTDSKGYFSLELGSNRGVIQDASEYSSSATNMGALTGGSSSQMGGMGGSDRKYMGCDLQAKLAGFRSQSISLSGRRPMDDPNVGTILLHRIGGQEEGITVSMVSLAAPKEAKKAYDKGMDALKKKKFEDAQNSFEKAVELYPKYAVAWYELGRLRASQDQYDIARGSFAEAIKADPKFVLPYVSLGYLELQAKRWQQLVEVTEKTIKLDPFDYPQSYFFNSVAHFNMRELEEAEKSALQAERLDTRNEFPQIHHLLGMVLADRKDWAGAAARFKNYLKLSPKAENADAVRKQLSQVERIQQQLATAKEQ
jgi:tetratricopeptide (TPR) repeat protein